jgi:microcystin-dependent protein
MANDSYIGAVYMFAGNFAPRGFQFCNGQLLSIAQNSALFAILGVTYGGNGVSTFALPDLRCRGPLGQGNGQGLSPVVAGEMSGQDNVSILTSNLPMHNHLINVSSQPANAVDPTGSIQAVVNDGAVPTPNSYAGYATTPPTGLAAPTSMTAAGGSIPLNIQNPYLGLSMIICTQGLFPSRN